MDMRVDASPESRRLIVNADDFGLSAGVNLGVAKGHIHGVVTSASLMVHWPDAAPAVASARSWRDFSLGLHLDLGEWRYDDGTWLPYYERVEFDDATAVGAEIEAQLNAFHGLVGRVPTHIDSHQHVHHREPVRRLLLERVERLGVPVRGLTGGVAYSGSFYGLRRDGTAHVDAISYAGFLDALHPLADDVVEMGCHPAASVDFVSMYRDERVAELKTLCDPRLRSAIGEAGFVLTTFAELMPGSAAGQGRVTT